MSDEFIHYEGAIERFCDMYNQFYKEAFPVENLRSHADINISHMIKMDRLKHGFDLAKTIQVVTDYVNELYGKDAEPDDLHEFFDGKKKDENKEENRNMQEDEKSYSPPHHKEAEVVSFAPILLETDDGWAKINWTFRGTTADEVVAKWDGLYAMKGVRPGEFVDGFGDTKSPAPQDPYAGQQPSKIDPHAGQEQVPIPPQDPQDRQQQAGGQSSGGSDERDRDYVGLHYEMKGDNGAFRPYHQFENEYKAQGYIFEGGSDVYSQLRKIVGDEFLDELRKQPGQMAFLPIKKRFHGWYHLEQKEGRKYPFTVWHRLLSNAPADINL